MSKGERLSGKLVLQHEMLILDANLENTLDQSKMKEITNDLIEDLLDELQMKKLGPLEIYDATDPRAPGWSFIQPITTSHISGHYFIEPDGSNPNIHMDFYSCSSFEWTSIIPIIHKHLELNKWHADFLYRKDVRADRKIWEISGSAGTIISEKLLIDNSKFEEPKKIGNHEKVETKKIVEGSIKRNLLRTTMNHSGKSGLLGAANRMRTK